VSLVIWAIGIGLGWPDGGGVWIWILAIVLFWATGLVVGISALVYGGGRSALVGIAISILSLAIAGIAYCCFQQSANNARDRILDDMANDRRQ